MSGGNCFLKNNILSQQYCDSNNGDLSSGYVFLNSRTISQCEDLITFKNIADDVEKGDGDVSSGYVLKTATLSPIVTIKATLRILMVILKRVLLVLYLVI